MQVWNETELIEASRLKEMKSPYNPRKIRKTAQKKLSGSLEKFGQVVPLVANKRTGHLVGGHQRVEVALESDPSAKLLVNWIDVDEVDEKALNIMLNNHSAQGEFDNDKLSDLVRDIISNGGASAALAAGLNQDDIAKLALNAQSAASEAVAQASNSVQRIESWDIPATEDMESPAPPRERTFAPLESTLPVTEFEPEEMLATLAFSMTIENRAVVLEAIEKAKANGATSNANALVTIAKEYLQ